MKNKYIKNLLLLVAVIVIVGTIYYLQQPDVVTDTETGEEIVLGPQGDKVAVDVGNFAQDFLLADYDGEVHKLSDYRGQPVLLNFWATWCPFCVEEMPLFNDVLGDYEDLVIIAVNRGESLEQTKKFTDPMGLDYLLLLNNSDDVADSYQVNAMPTSLFILPNGEIQEVKFGPIEDEELKEKLDTLVGTEVEYVEKEEVTGTAESGRTIMITDGIKHSVDMKDIMGGGPAKDGIPSLDDPEFISVSEANEFLNDDGIGVALSLNGIDRFYPNQITVYHEIVNDNLGGQAALVTYCPLCGTGIVFDPIVNGKVVEFGTSGKLWNSNLVMYDRETESYWSQVLGEAIVGEQTGNKLKLLPSDNIKWKDWKKEFPNGEVLSNDTGYSRDYSSSPYGDYDFNDDIYFPVDESNSTYHSKEPTFGLEFGDKTKAYTQEELDKGPAQFNDTFAGVELEINYDSSNKTIDITRKDDGSEVIPVYGFWFSWFAAHPNTEIYTVETS